MEQINENNRYKRIIVNTMSMYIRMIFLTLLSLYTVRIVLQQLGVSDYGIYNVVGGIVSMFSFASGTLRLASQRYFAYCLANENWKKLNHYFSMIMVIFFLYILVIVSVAETVGLWFLLEKMTIDEGRMTAAVCVYQFSIFSFILGIIVTPFQALLVAEENLKIYSVIAIFEGIMKLVIVYLLSVVSVDKLILYAFMLFLVSLIVDLVYIIYCHKRYKELKFKIVKEKTDYQEIWTYVGWNFIGSIANVCKGQGVNILINLFFNTTINAARGVATQVSTTVASFSQNFLTAVEPQITKSYALGNTRNFYNMLYVSSKLSFYVLYIISLPLICNMDYVLGLWLGEVPQYTVIFTILVLIDAMLASITDPIYTAVQSTGKVKWYQLVVGGASLLNLPITCITLLFHTDPRVPFVVSVIVTGIMTIGRLITFKAVSDFSIVQYIKRVFLRVSAVVLASCVLEIRVISHAKSFLELILNVLISVVINSILIWCIGIDSTERNVLLGLFYKRIVNQKVN